MSLIDDYRDLEIEYEALKEEHEENYRLLAMSGDRELSLITKLQNANEEIARLKRDADRYRWLRIQDDNSEKTPRIDVVLWTCEENDEGIRDSVNYGEGLRTEALDAKIDEYMNTNLI